MKFKDKSKETQKIFLKEVLDFFIDRDGSLNEDTYKHYSKIFKSGEYSELYRYGAPELKTKLKTLDIWQKDEVKEGALCWFWGDNYTQGVIDTLKHINKTPTISYRSIEYGWLSNCEPIKKHIKKLKKMYKADLEKS